MDAILRMQYMLETFDDNSLYADITKCLLRNLSQLRWMNIAQVAELSHVSQSTISKLIKRLGFEDFASFKLEIAESLALHDRGQYDVSFSCDHFEEDFTAWLGQLKQQVMAGLQTQDMAHFTEAAKALLNRKRITFASESIFPTSYFVSTLLIDGKDVIISKTLRQFRALSKTAGPDDVLIFYIGSTCEWPLLQSAMADIRTRGCIVICISNDIDFPYTQDVDFLFKHSNVSSNDVFLRELYIRILLSEYRRLRRRR